MPHIPIQHPISSYSKGARGLSVELRAPGFFTGTTNSLRIPPRQRSSRYAIHAGRNLPDKEFRSVLLHPVGWVSRFLFRSPLHVAMQLGPYHSPMAITGDLAYGL